MKITLKLCSILFFLLIGLSANAQLEKPKPAQKPIPQPTAPTPKPVEVKKPSVKPSVINAQKAKSKLAKDSVGKKDAYYYRINKVKQVTQEASNSKVVHEIDRFGNLTATKVWFNNKLVSSSEYEYNEYSDLTRSVVSGYGDDGKLENEEVAIFSYVIDLGASNEKRTRQELTYTTFENGESKASLTLITLYEYHENGTMSKSDETGTDPYCSEGAKRFKRVTEFTYDNFQKLLSEDIQVTGGCDGSHSEKVEYTYSGPGYLARATKSVRSVIQYEATYQNNAEGRTLRYTIWDGNGESVNDATYTYNSSGLVESVISVQPGIGEDLETYAYAYY